MIKLTEKKKQRNRKRNIDASNDTNNYHHSKYQNETDISSRSSAQIIHSAKSSNFKRPQVTPPTLSESTKWRYIGVCTKYEAEIIVHHLTEFRFYHQWDPSVNLNDIHYLPLTVVYRSSAGDHFHWLVRTMGEIIKNKDTKRKEYKIRSYYIEHSGPSLPTLNELIKCYENRTYNRYGHVDVFRLQ
uniref:Uncharacterized protein n=1 Tax=Onchocerca volvulus TaxID=6282 RepID=A0A2K6VRE4_ONCVO